MDRTRLTASLSFEMFGLLCIPIVILIAVSNYQLNLPVILILVLLFGMLGFFFYYLLKLKTIEFDDSFVYFSDNGKEEKVPIQNIRFIKLTMGGMNNKDFWKMKYLSVDKAEKSLTFVPKVWLKELFKFQELVKSKNPNAVIENAATSLDID